MTMLEPPDGLRIAGRDPSNKPTPAAAEPSGQGTRRLGTVLAISIVLAVLLAGGATVWRTLHPRVELAGGLGTPAIGGPFLLIDGDGHPVTQASWPNRYLLVYFGYTFCPDVCPTTLSDLAQALDRLGKRADLVQPLFVTIDPRRDTASVVKQYAAAFSPRIVGLTGSPAQIAEVAREYRVYYAEHRTGPKLDDYSMDHSSILYLMAPDGQFVAVLRADASPEDLAADLAKRLPQG